MSEKNIGNALLRGEAPIDLETLTHRVLRRDRRRMWLLGTACVIAWMFVVMLPWATIFPMLARVVELQAEINRNAATAQHQEPSTLVLQVVKQGTLATFIGSIASMFVAALCTVSFVIFSRRVTLRQMNDRLAEIFAQLKTLAGESK